MIKYKVYGICTLALACINARDRTVWPHPARFLHAAEDITMDSGLLGQSSQGQDFPALPGPPSLLLSLSSL